MSKRTHGEWPESDSVGGAMFPDAVIAELNAIIDRIEKHRRLHEAAPDLLEACKKVVKECYVSDNADGGAIAEMSADVLDTIRAAIAKAEGGGQ